MNSIQIYGISNSQNIQFKGYVDKTIENRMKSIAAKQMQGKVKRVNMEIEKLIEKEKLWDRDIPHEQIQKLQEELRQALTEIVDKTSECIEQLNVFMEKLHPNSVLKISKNKKGEDIAVVANKVAKNEYDIDQAVPGFEFSRCTDVSKIEKFTKRVLGNKPNEVDETILNYALEELEKMAIKTSLIGRFFMRMKMNMIESYAKQIKRNHIYKGSREDMQNRVRLVRNAERHRRMTELKKPKETKAAQQESWEIFNTLFSKLYREKILPEQNL